MYIIAFQPILYQFTLDKVVSVSEERIFGIYSVHIVAGLSSRLWSKLYFGTLTFWNLEEQKKRGQQFADKNGRSTTQNLDSI